MKVDGQARFIAQGGNQGANGARAAHAGHVFNAQDMRAGFFQLPGHADVILEVKLGALRIENVARVANRRFAYATGFDYAIHGHAHVVYPVERIEDAENIHAGCGCLANEKLHHVIRIIGVTHGIGRAQQHLERNVRHARAQVGQPLPRVFFQKAQGHIESGAAPAFHGEQLRQQAGIVRRDVQHVTRAHACGKQRLMRIAHAGVGQHHLRIGAQPLRKTLRTQCFQAVACAGWRRIGQLPARLHGRGCGMFRLFAPVHLRVAIDHHIADKAQQARGAVTARAEAEQFRCVVDKACGAFARTEQRMGNHVLQKIQVGGQATDAKLAQRAIHARDGLRRRLSARGDFDQKRVKKRRDDGAAIGRAGIQAHAKTRCAAVGGDRAVIGREIVFRVFRSDAALQGVGEQSHLLLRGQARVFFAHARALADADLRFDNINAGDFFGDRMLDLDARIHLDEIVTAGVGIQQKLHRAGVRIAHLAAQFQGRFAQFVACGVVKIRGGRALHDFLVAPLHRAVAFKQMDELAVRVTQDLHFHMAGMTDEFFQVHFIAAKCRQRLAPSGGHELF